MVICMRGEEVWSGNGKEGPTKVGFQWHLWRWVFLSWYVLSPTTSLSVETGPDGFDRSSMGFSLIFVPISTALQGIRFVWHRFEAVYLRISIPLVYGWPNVFPVSVYCVYCYLFLSVYCYGIIWVCTVLTSLKLGYRELSRGLEWVFLYGLGLIWDSHQ